MVSKINTSPSIVVEINEILSAKFDAKEIKILCFELGIDEENLEGKTKKERILSLVQWIERRDELEKLILKIKEHRPNISEKLNILLVKLTKSENETENQNQFENLLKSISRPSFNVLIVGAHGVGKSSTVNSLMGEIVAKTNALRPETREVTSYLMKKNGVSYTFIDTPGLCDDVPQKQNDKKYISLIKEKVKEVDSLWFIVKLNERLRIDEIRALRIINQAFGRRVWDRCVLVLTHSDQVTEKDFSIIKEERTKIIKEKIALIASPQKANNIPAVAITNLSPRTPDGNLWLGSLYTKIIVRMSEKGLAPFLLTTLERVEIKKKDNKENRSTSSSLTNLSTLFSASSGISSGSNGNSDGGFLGGRHRLGRRR